MVSIEKRLGSNTQNSVVLASGAIANFNPNASSLLTGLVSYWNLNEASGTRGDSIGVVPLMDNGGVIATAGIKGNSALMNTTTANFNAISFSICCNDFEWKQKFLIFFLVLSYFNND